jgi:hypothetical protein
MLMLTPACSSQTAPDGSSNNNGSNPNGCTGTATGTFAGTVNGSPWSVSCLNVANLSGTITMVATDGTTGVTLSFPSSSGTYTVGPTGVLTGQLGVGANTWLAAGTNGTGTLTVTVTQTTLVGTVNMTLAANTGTGATGSKAFVASFNLKY